LCPVQNHLNNGGISCACNNACDDEMAAAANECADAADVAAGGAIALWHC